MFLRRTRHVACIVTLYSVLVPCALASQLPSQGKGDGEAQPSTKQATPTQPQTERGTQANPLFVQQSFSATQAVEDHQDRQDNQANRRYALWLSVITAVVVALQVWLLFRQNTIISGQSTIMSGQLEAAKTGTAIALAHKRIGDNTLATQREIERAYISFYPARVHMLRARDNQGGGDPSRPLQLSVDIHIRNSGRTPGTFLGGYIGYSVGDRPTLPSLSTGTRLHAPAFLHPDEHVDFGIDVKASAGENVEATLKGIGHLWIIGVVDYEDRFGGLHQFGFGRKFNAMQTTLQFTPETANWNYDRPMHPDNVRNYQEAKRQQSQETDA